MIKKNLKIKNYMFSGKYQKNNLELPKEFIPFLDYINNKFNDNYNQVVVNWFENGNTFIPLHSDCELNIVNNSSIVIISLGESRVLRIEHKKGKGDCCIEKMDINCNNGTVITMNGDFQKEYVHGIPKSISSVKDRRISISFRKYVNEPLLNND